MHTSVAAELAGKAVPALLEGSKLSKGSQGEDMGRNDAVLNKKLNEILIREDLVKKIQIQLLTKY